MTQDDVLFGYRLQVFDLAGRTSVSHACRIFGIHRSTYYASKQQVECGGLEMLRGLVKRGLVGVQLAISDAHPGLTAAVAKVLGCPWQRCTVLP